MALSLCQARMHTSSPRTCTHTHTHTRTHANTKQQVIKRAADNGDLVSVALNTHGTRAVQKLIETLTSREQRALVVGALAPGVVTLIKDLNGNHVVQRCLQRLGPDDSQFVYDAARVRGAARGRGGAAATAETVWCVAGARVSPPCPPPKTLAPAATRRTKSNVGPRNIRPPPPQEHCVEIATHRHGCCVLQRCVDFASPPQKVALVERIASHALVLSQVRAHPSPPLPGWRVVAQRRRSGLGGQAEH